MKQTADKYVTYWLISLDGRIRMIFEPVQNLSLLSAFTFNYFGLSAVLLSCESLQL